MTTFALNVWNAAAYTLRLDPWWLGNLEGWEIWETLHIFWTGFQPQDPGKKEKKHNQSNVSDITALKSGMGTTPNKILCP